MKMNRYERMMKNKKKISKKNVSMKGPSSRRKVGNFFQYNYVGSAKKEPETAVEG